MFQLKDTLTYQGFLFFQKEIKNFLITLGNVGIDFYDVVVRLLKLRINLKESKEIELDYLQVFKIRRNNEELIIEHTQEMPEYKKVYLFNNLGSLIEEDLKIFIIDENDYNIMLLAEEYWLKGGGKERMVQVLNGKEKK